MVKKKTRSVLPRLKSLIEPSHPELSVSQQCKLLGVSRSTYYYTPRESEENELYKSLIFQEYIKHPFYGYRKITKALVKQGYKVNRKRILRLMREMAIQAIYPKPNLSKPVQEHKKYPYLLRGMEIKRANQAWATDITYIRVPSGFIYLVAILDIFSRKILSWKISNTLDVNFCREALDEAIKKYGKPEIFNSDQGSQFTSKDFTGRLEELNIKISMDGKGRALDNIYIERFWRSLKYENIYIVKYESMKECKEGVKRYFEFYNTERFHQSLDYKTPDEIYYGFDSQLEIKKAS